MKRFVFFAIFTISVILVSNNDNPIFAMHEGVPHHEQDMRHQNMMGLHHSTHNGMCAPGFAALDEICVLDDRCGPGAYAGKICMMDGVMKQYLRPLHQKHAGISVDNIICAEGKKLMFKHHNASPACVNSASVEKLKQRGWQTEKPAIACTMEYDPVCGMDGITYGNHCMLNSEYMVMKHPGECMDTSIANPASTYCVENGGTLTEETDEKGTYNICTLSDGTQCEEWSYFRGECPIDNSAEISEE